MSHLSYTRAFGQGDDTHAANYRAAALSGVQLSFGAVSVTP